MPDPGLVARPGPEVRSAIVVDLGGETQEAAVGGGAGRGSAAGQTVLLMGTLKRVHGPVLQIGCLLHHRGIQDQVWGSWVGGIERRKRQREKGELFTTLTVTLNCRSHFLGFQKES